jgi:hypothetical protein
MGIARVAMPITRKTRMKRPSAPKISPTIAEPPIRIQNLRHPGENELDLRLREEVRDAVEAEH